MRSRVTLLTGYSVKLAALLDTFCPDAVIPACSRPGLRLAFALGLCSQSLDGWISSVIEGWGPGSGPEDGAEQELDAYYGLGASETDALKWDSCCFSTKYSIVVREHTRPGGIIRGLDHSWAMLHGRPTLSMTFDFSPVVTRNACISTILLALRVYGVGHARHDTDT